MANLDLNELLNRSIAKATGGTVVEESVAPATKTPNLALNLEAIEEKVGLNLDPEILTKLKAALAAGVATSAVLEARQLARAA